MHSNARIELASLRFGQHFGLTAAADRRSAVAILVMRQVLASSFGLFETE